MNNKSISTKIAALGLAVLGAQAHAQWNQTIEMREVMLESMGAQAIDLVISGGYREIDTLLFDTQINFEAGAFAFTTQPNQTYMGQNASISVSGIFDSEDRRYEWQGAVTLGDANWNTTGWLEFESTLDDAKKSKGKDMKIDGKDGVLYDTKYSLDKKGNPFSSGRFQYWSKRKVDGKWVDEFHDVKAADKIENGVEMWGLAMGDINPGIDIAGFRDLTTGFGTAEVAIGSLVPEPASILALSMACGALLRSARRKR